MKRLGSVSLRVASVLVVMATLAAGQEAAPPNPSLLKATFSKLPIYFIENRGVYPDEVAYYVPGADKTLFFTKHGITFRLKGKDRGWVVKLEFVGANPAVVPRGVDRQQAVFSYFKGPEEDWKTGLETYTKVVYEDLWPGIDLVYRGTVNRLKYEFLLKPGADPRKIRLRYRGAAEVEVTETGGLGVKVPVGEFEDARPVAYQEIEGERVEVQTAFVLDEVEIEAGRGFGFKVGRYDPTRTLVLDPAMLLYCGYVGGAGDGGFSGIAVDATGNAYVTGWTLTDERTFPVKVGPDLTHNGGLFDALVAKVNPQGTALVYCGYIGGTGDRDIGYGIAVDAAGNAYVTGTTTSTEQTFPVRVGPDVTYNGIVDAFVAKVNPQGTALLYCGYIGGNSGDLGHGIAVDASGNAYVTGETASTQQTFPVKVGPDLTYNGSGDAFVAKVDPHGTALVYCGYIGGSSRSVGHGIAVDAGGEAYVAGETRATEQSFPVTVGPGSRHSGGSDAFVAKVDQQGTGFVYCGYIGGSGNDYGYGIAVDASGHAYVTGETGSTELSFPVRVGPDLTHNGGNDAFVASVDAQGKGLVYCGYIGGALLDVGRGVAVDPAGSAMVAGYTFSTEQTFPVKVGPDVTYNGGSTVAGDAFVAKVSAQGRALVYCGYIGGAVDDTSLGIAVDAAGCAYVTGWTRSDERTFPVTVGPDTTYNGGSPFGGDAFLAKISLTLLQGSGAPRPGSTLSLTLTATHDVARPYRIASSLGTGPIPIDSRKLGLSPDNLFFVTLNDYWPWTFSGYRGVIDSKGQANAAIHLPNIPALIGVRLHSAFVTLDPAAPSGIRSISDTFTFTVTR